MATKARWLACTPQPKPGLLPFRGHGRAPLAPWGARTTRLAVVRGVVEALAASSRVWEPYLASRTELRMFTDAAESPHSLGTFYEAMDPPSPNLQVPPVGGGRWKPSRRHNSMGPCVPSTRCAVYLAPT